MWNKFFKRFAARNPVSRSRLQEFIEFVDTATPSLKVQMRLRERKTGDALLSVEFEGERTHEFELGTTVLRQVHENPYRLIDCFQEDVDFARVNRKFDSFLSRHAAMNTLSNRMLFVNFRLGKLQQRLGDPVNVVFSRTEQQTALKMDELKREEASIYKSSPYFLERFEAIYRFFLTQRYPEEESCTDAIEADLSAIVANEGLSSETRARAAKLLEGYLHQRHQSVNQVGLEAERQALVVLETIENHYVKGEGRR